MISQKLEIRQGDQVIVPVDNLQVPEVGCPLETFVRKVTAAHLCWSVEAWGPGVDNLTTKLHHARMPCQVIEQECWPVSYE